MSEPENSEQATEKYPRSKGPCADKFEKEATINDCLRPISKTKETVRKCPDLEVSESRTDNKQQNEDKPPSVDQERGNMEKDNNLDKYLRDVFERECDFGIEETDVAFIQCGIETLVQKMADMVREQGQETLEECIDICKEWNPHLVQIQTSNNFVKVGSFYERTRNSFPDEFDFIFIICTFQSDRVDSFDSPDLDFPLTEVNFTTFEKVCDLCKSNLSYTDFPLGQRKLRFDDYVQEHGPAFMIQFIYTNECGEERIINVDFVSAFKIVDNKIEENAKKLCKLEPFRSELISTGGYLIANGNITFTESEVNFMRNVLSQSHVKVYRLLKYIINGHGDEELLEGLNIRGYPSYKIKTTIIYHHYSCKNNDLAHMGQCVLDVLDDLYERKNNPCGLVRETYFPVVATKEFSESLKDTTDNLKSMKCSDDCYMYDKDKIKTVCRQLFDHTNKI